MKKSGNLIVNGLKCITPTSTNLLRFVLESHPSFAFIDIYVRRWFLLLTNCLRVLLLISIWLIYEKELAF